jgi:hypothetical protein
MEKPKTLPDDQWAEVVKALETRKEQLNDELLRPDRHRVRDDAEGLLRDLMERDGQKVHKNQNGQDSQEEDA